MKVDADKEERGSVGMGVADKSAEVYVTADVGNGGEGYCDVCCVVYG